ncbi:alpha/beta hydrolase [Ornithinimicrobium cerasi]|uniref:Alpha/beta hydrolase fold n=1 Tax=Ornithinimicrobium cerasi TaxID=2248773 RepID=A0A285VQG1_9MICO|nr:alpha/beta hydrolase [Ornithinimicrobium cerasi]SOC56310.1 alpha/beta hydrolase fold [Ornithinimicrobium cerasi]
MATLHTRRRRDRPGAARPSRLVPGLVALSLLAGCSGGQGAPDATSVEPSGGGVSSPDATSGSPDGAAGETSDGTSASVAVDAPEGLEDFYGQELGWTSCESLFECATVTVPIDYAEPTGGTIEIAVLRAPARGEGQGSLLVNPGGPGASGVDYAMSAGAVFSEEVRRAYDVVGFDPRGVGRSAPVNCVSDAELDVYLGHDTTPDDEAERDRQEEVLRGFAEGCLENAPDLAPHLSTVEAARDMDVLRSALGEETVTYVGASYGTYLGTIYANLFPDRVGRFVLDGAMDPTLEGEEVGRGQAAGFERATRAYVEDCVAQGGCPLGSDVESAMERIPAFLDELDAQPLPVQGDTVTELTEGWAFYGIAVAMYDQTAWPILSQAFEAAFAGNGTLLMFLANAYARRGSDGSYSSNMMEAFQAIGCLVPESAETEEKPVAERVAEFSEVAPTWGRYFGAVSVCEYWEVNGSEEPEDYSASGAAPIVVIGTTRDPATPYEWAEGLAEVLESGVLISYDGDGHTAYGRSNDCVDDAVDAYLLEGTVPQDGLRC